MKTVPADELSTELSESRRSLFKSCQEHFGVTPTQLQGSMHLDGVRIDRNQFGELPKKNGFKSEIQAAMQPALTPAKADSRTELAQIVHYRAHTGANRN